MRLLALLTLVMGYLSGCASSCRASADEPFPPDDSGLAGDYVPSIMDWLPNTRWNCEWHGWWIVNGVEERSRVSHQWRFQQDTYSTNLAERLVEEVDGGRVSQETLSGSIWADSGEHGGVAQVLIHDQAWEPLGAESILGLWRNDTLNSVYQSSRISFLRDGTEHMTIDTSAMEAFGPITCTRTLF